MDSSLVVQSGLCLVLAGVIGFSLLKSDVILLLVSLEVMLLGVNMIFLGSSFCWDDLMGQVFVLFVLTVAAAEAAIGLAILVVFSKVRGSVDLDSLPLLHGLFKFMPQLDSWTYLGQVTFICLALVIVYYGSKGILLPKVSESLKAPVKLQRVLSGSTSSKGAEMEYTKSV